MAVKNRREKRHVVANSAAALQRLRCLLVARKFQVVEPMVVENGW